MKILFEIKESLADIENQLLHSDFWITEVEEHPEEGKKIVTIRDFAYPQEATAEITDKGILIKTAWSKYTYRLFQKDNSYWCEYTGAYRGLLEQKLLPMITPKENLLDQEVTSSLYGNTTASASKPSATSVSRQATIRSASTMLLSKKTIFRIEYSKLQQIAYNGEKASRFPPYFFVLIRTLPFPFFLNMVYWKCQYTILGVSIYYIGNVNVLYWERQCTILSASIQYFGKSKSQRRKSPFPAEAGKRLLRVSRSVLPRRERCLNRIFLITLLILL